ncbi:MAG: hypothetical protein ACRDY2_02615 [Acidimicrobiales bacterium]
MAVIALPQAASATCSNSAHCYNIINQPETAVNGSVLILNASCLYNVSPSGFADFEMWDDITPKPVHWTEAGLIEESNVGIPGNRGLFWADDTPSHGFQFHVDSTQGTSLNTRYVDKIDYKGGVSSGITMGPLAGTSTFQQYPINLLQAGSEFTDASDRTAGDISSLTRYDTNNTYTVGWPSAYFEQVGEPAIASWVSYGNEAKLDYGC